MLPSQVSRKWGGRERFRGQQPLGSDFPCFTTTKIVFQETCLKEFSPSTPQRGESLEEHPSVTASNTILGSACQQHSVLQRQLCQPKSSHSTVQRRENTFLSTKLSHCHTARKSQVQSLPVQKSLHSYSFPHWQQVVWFWTKLPKPQYCDIQVCISPKNLMSYHLSM